MRWIKVVKKDTLAALTHHAATTLTVAEAQKLAASRLLCCAACSRRFGQNELFVPDTADCLILLCGPHMRSCQVPVTYQRASAVLPSLVSMVEHAMSAAAEHAQREKRAAAARLAMFIARRDFEAEQALRARSGRFFPVKDLVAPRIETAKVAKPVRTTYADMLAADAARAAKHTDARQSA